MTVLRACRAALVDRGAPLLILERLLPDDGDALTMARV